MRVVVDTNVWLSALLWGGQPDLIAQLVELKQIKAISSEEILTEFAEILQKAKFQKRLNQLGFTADEVTIMAKRLMTFVVIEELLVPELRDPKDQMILATAIAGNAEVIISGDKDLLTLHPFRDISIFSPFEFLSIYFPGSI
jgi:uncharacterized protein